MDAIFEMARKYLAKMESPRRAANDSQDSHLQVFWAAVVLVQGWALGDGDAMTLLREYCGRSDEPWEEWEMERKVQQAHKASPKQGYGWLRKGKRGEVGWMRGAERWKPSAQVREETKGRVLPRRPTEPKYNAEALIKVAGDLRGQVDLIWLANRSWIDPATVDAAGFLAALYDRETEKVITFTYTNRKGMPVGQGDAVWPDNEGSLPAEGPRGVWYLAAPVDGKYRETGELDERGQPKFSRRNGTCVLSWRWMVVESDDAPAVEWLAALAKLPLRIAALYTSGGRSVHALVRTPARTKEEWDDFKDSLKPALVVLGADPGCMSAVRLTRLPGTLRKEKGKLQKLLYLDPRADGRPLCDMPMLRDVEAHWCALAAGGVADADETGGEWIRRGLSHYASRSKRCEEALKAWKGVNA